MRAGVIAQIQKRQLAYQQTFAVESPAVQQVLADLARFCKMYDTTFHPDARVSAHLEGRREVFLRIREYLNLTSEEIMKLHKIKEVNTHEE